MRSIKTRWTSTLIVGPIVLRKIKNSPPKNKSADRINFCQFLQFSSLYLFISIARWNRWASSRWSWNHDKVEKKTSFFSSYFSKRNEQEVYPSVRNSYTSLRFNGFWIKDRFVPRPSIIYVIELLPDLAIGAKKAKACEKNSRDNLTPGRQFISRHIAQERNKRIR